MNNDIPDKVVIRQLQKKVDKLEKELKLKNKAIIEFKKWQGRVAVYKYQYWLHEALEFMEEPPESHQLKALNAVNCNYGNFKKHLKNAKAFYDAYQKSLKDLKETVNDGQL